MDQEIAADLVKFTKEQVYDEQIAPLIGQISKICKEHDIANFMSFSLGTSEPDGEVLCSTGRLEKSTDPPAKFFQIVEILQLAKKPPMVKMVAEDGTETLVPMI